MAARRKRQVGDLGVDGHDLLRSECPGLPARIHPSHQRLQRLRGVFWFRGCGGYAASTFIQLSMPCLEKISEHGERVLKALEEQSQNELALRLAQASIGELTAEIDAHLEAEAQLQEEMSQLNASILAVTQSAQDAGGELRRLQEKQLINAKLKDSALAVRILAQAIAILVDLQASGALAGGAREQAAAQAKAALGSAKTSFEAQGHRALKMRGELAQVANELAMNSAEAVRTQKRERMNLESAFDSHASQRSRLEESRRMHDVEVKQSTTYLASLEDECKTNINDLQDQERKELVSACRNGVLLLTSGPRNAISYNVATKLTRIGFATEFLELDAGFLGRELCRALLRGEGPRAAGGGAAEIERIVLFDVALPAGGAGEAIARRRRKGTGSPEIWALLNPRVESRAGDITDPAVCRALVCEAGEGPLSVFHMAGVMSGQAEKDFDTGLRVNLDGTRHIRGLPPARWAAARLRVLLLPGRLRGDLRRRADQGHRQDRPQEHVRHDEGVRGAAGQRLHPQGLRRRPLGAAAHGRRAPGTAQRRDHVLLLGRGPGAAARRGRRAASGAGPAPCGHQHPGSRPQPLDVPRPSSTTPSGQRAS
ncbi:unnamed protein product [Prorocentrum cordatum]|uniref:Uncharacterized protein n=1 Tax=Prorocentrum cordatum TaxID=2364126 RepID=A0ABN9SNS7_9DINO|nr:unnamed protein product [Polarella glacialis]